MKDEVFASPEELLAYQRETYRMALENQKLANSNFANIWPWRFLAFRRVHKQIETQAAEIDRRFEVGEAGYRALLDKFAAEHKARRALKR